MSGVVNKSVADKAVTVRADELIRKPFQPQDLISRVKALLEPKRTVEDAPKPQVDAPSALSGLFAPQPVPTAPPAGVPAPFAPSSLENSWPRRALADAFAPRAAAPAPPAPAPQRQAVSNVDLQKLRGEISRLELLIKKLQTELQIERQYNQALELHVRTLTALDQS
jgi:DNA-binding response OmpR family regulator